MTKITQPPFSLNESIILQVKEAFSLYYYLKIIPDLREQSEIYLPLTLEFLSQFLEEMHPAIFSKIPDEALFPALDFSGEEDQSELFDYIEKTSNSVFVSPQLFFENISVLKTRIVECWFYPLDHHVSRLQRVNSKIKTGLIAHYKYKYLSFPLHFGKLRSEKTE